MHRKNKQFRKIGLIAATSENEVLSSLIYFKCFIAYSGARMRKDLKSNFISSASCGKFIDLFSKLSNNKESFKYIVHHRVRALWCQYGLISKK